MLPTIDVDDSKCTSIRCGLCMRICPARALGLGTNISPKKGKETPEENFILRGVRFGYCSVCRKCEEVCPTKAIRVSWPGGKN